jgi:hypothetical protein
MTRRVCGMRRTRRVCESVSRPPCGFWCLNDETIKEIMSFAKCETGKNVL